MQKDSGSKLVSNSFNVEKLGELATTMLNGGARLIADINEANEREMSSQEHNLMQMLIKTNITRRNHGAKLLTILLPIDKRKALYKAICDMRAEVAALEFRLFHKSLDDEPSNVDINDDADFANFLVKETIDLRFEFSMSNNGKDWQVIVK